MSMESSVKVICYLVSLFGNRLFRFMSDDWLVWMCVVLLF